jgi:flagellar assembly factor FliW
MKLLSTRFGELEIRDDAVLDFPDGLIGLPGQRYALLAQTEESPFWWLHSAEHPDVAVPVTNPWLFFPAYEVRVPDEDANRLQLDSPAQASIFCIVRATEHVEDMTANLAAPVILHIEQRLGRQIINDAGGYPIRQPLFTEVLLDEVNTVTPDVSVVAMTG